MFHLRDQVVLGVPVSPLVLAGCGAGCSEVPGDFAGGGGRGPAPLVGDGVVARAEQCGVGQGGGAAVDPVNEVVGVGPHGWRGAPGDGAALVAQPHGSEHPGGEQAPGPADVQDLGVGAQHDRDDGRVAGDPADCLGCQEPAGQQGGPGPAAVGEVAQVDGDEQGGLGGGRGGAPGGGRPAADLDQGLAAALLGGAQVRACRGGSGCGQGSEDGFQDLAAFGVQA